MNQKAVQFLIETINYLVRENEIKEALDLMVKDVSPIKESLNMRINSAYQSYNMAIQQQGVMTSEQFNAQLKTIGQQLGQIVKDVIPALRLQMRLKKYKGIYSSNMEFDLEKIVGDTSELLPINWIYQALQASKSVCQIRTGKGSLGTGWLLKDGWIMTNSHVISNKNEVSSAKAVFNYEKDLNGDDKTEFSYEMEDTGARFSNPLELDYAYIKLKDDPANPLSQWGHLNLDLDDELKIAIDDRVNIIQHPKGKQKQVALNQNRVLALDGYKLFYTTDTEPGSSGAPVFNNNWEVIALHHAGKVEDGGLVINSETNEKKPANRGILIKDIIDDINNQQRNKG